MAPNILNLWKSLVAPKTLCTEMATQSNEPELCKSNFSFVSWQIWVPLVSDILTLWKSLVGIFLHAPKTLCIIHLSTLIFHYDIPKIKCFKNSLLSSGPNRTSEHSSFLFSLVMLEIICGGLRSNQLG